MTTVRRIYAYLLTFAGLAMISFAAANLLQLLVDLALHSPTVSTDRYVRDTVSFSVAAALVGLPVWLLHWTWIARSARSDPQDRASTLRRLYVYAVLAAATLEMAGSARDALFNAFAALVGMSTTSVNLDAIARPLPFTFIALCVWIAHWRIAAADRAIVGERGGSATLRRWYVYAAAFVGLMLLLTGTQAVLESLWRIVTQSGGPAGAGLPHAAADALVGLGLWLVHWVVLPRPIRKADAGEDDSTTSVLRRVYLFLALAVAVIGSLLGLSQLLYYAVGRLLGVDRPGGVGGDLVQAAAGPASIVIVYGCAWAATRNYQNLGPAGGETPRQAGVRRLYVYLIALVAVGLLASGVAGLLWTLGDVVFSDPAAATGFGWREQVALFATLTLVGLPVWLLHWRPNPAAAAEARSLARRLYLYLTLMVAMLALIGSAAAGLYELLGLALGNTFSVSLATDLVHELAVASVAAVLAAYHWRVIRADGERVRAESASSIATIQPIEISETSEPTSTSVSASAVVEINAADAETLCQALTALRSTGVEVRVLPPHEYCTALVSSP